MLISLTLFAALANDSCQVYPSEYAYKRNTVFGSERSSAKCRPYESGLDDRGTTTQNYNHCDGTQLRLADSDLGSEKYNNSNYYVWNAQSAMSNGYQLLFIFPKRVNLTTITLHYYSDNIRGLPRLRLWSVPDGFEIWDAPTTTYSHVDIAAVSPGGEPAGRRNFNINVANVNFTTNKVLLLKYSSSFPFAVSEVELFECIGKQAKRKFYLILLCAIIINYRTSQKCNYCYSSNGRKNVKQC